MVLPAAPLNAKIWGWTSSGNQAVTVTLNPGAVVLRATSSQFAPFGWSVSINSPNPSFTQYSLKISSSGVSDVVFSNVLFGDVYPLRSSIKSSQSISSKFSRFLDISSYISLRYLCSGQSNMQMSVSSALNATAEAAAANAFPNIRLFTAGETSSYDQLVDFNSVRQRWSIASSSSVSKDMWSYFSAACWFMGKRIHQETNIPIGLMAISWGGTLIEPWMCDSALRSCGQAAAVGTGLATSNNIKGGLWNAMISPVINWQFRGVAWYQGESNAYAPTAYECLLPSMIRDWRTKFGRGDDMAFLVVQLAAYVITAPGTTNLGKFRIAQMKSMNLPRVGIASAIDAVRFQSTCIESGCLRIRFATGRYSVWRFSSKR
jgi:hypothetical protein